ncbi:TIR domain-containing protein [Nocardia sp. XZ_19_385]|uniref:nSTAND1 domain-containing NTPase n=1 Tax=Nocardia sp. XZ_19_385 TaxID=2769488 RepID=UPI00188EF253|nr:TIR domain-containing protein [Nocardia sp. XZ_19_385]
MTRIFLSHSSKDNAAAIALRQWLIEQDPGLAEDIFLDLSHEAGIPAGTRWKEALVRANERCEAVICLLSANWQGSRECVVEYRTAENLGKRIFSARLERLTETDVTREWQRCDLFGAGPHTEIAVAGYDPVSFRTEGLQRLLHGLRTAGIGAQHFPWPPPQDPGRCPYRGWQPFESADAAIYFGRDAQIVRGMDLLRGMRTTGKPSVFAILGPSGTGKSSFLRAGLLPRLSRDDRQFAVLDIVRPERAALTGAHGLAAAIHATRTRLGLSGTSLGDIKSALPHRVDLVREWLGDIVQAAHARLFDSAEAQPTLVLPIDQTEELFGADAGVEGDQLLDLLAELLTGPDRVPLLIALTIRTDRYELFQTAPQLADVETLVFDHLKPLPRTRFREVITGPAARATAAGHRLEIEPALLDKLVADCTDGADTLPLLALTLARLHQDYGDDGVLRLDEYVAMGGMSVVVRTEIDALLAGRPAERRKQLKVLRTAFIPWLATVNPENDQPLRRIARWSDLPAESHDLIDRFVDARLMVKDHRNGETVVEVAVESLLRQWDELAAWLRAEAEALKDADTLEQSALAWDRNERDDAWLLHGTRLVEAETLTAAPGFRERLQPARTYLAASRVRENELAEVEKQRQREELRVAKERQEAAEALAAASSRAEREAQQYAEAIRSRSRGLLALAVISLVISMVAAIGFVQARQARDEVETRSREATALQLIAHSKAMVSGARSGGPVLASQLVLAALELSSHERVRAAAVELLYMSPDLRWMNESESIHRVTFSPDGTRVVVAGTDGKVGALDAHTGLATGDAWTGAAGPVMDFSADATRVLSWASDLRMLDTRTGQILRQPLEVPDPLGDMALSPDGLRIAYQDREGLIRVVDSLTGQRVGVDMTGSRYVMNRLEFSPDGSRIASVGNGVRVWDIGSGKVVATVEDATGVRFESSAFNSDGSRIIIGADDGSIRVWDVDADQSIGVRTEGHTGSVSAVAFSPDGRRVVSGGNDGTIRVRQLVARDEHTVGVLSAGQPLTGHVGMVRTVGFAPDGMRIVSGGADGTVRIWEPPLEMFSVEGAEYLARNIWSVAFSQNGERMVTGAGNGTVRVWDARNGRPAGPLLGVRNIDPSNEAVAKYLAVSADGKKVAAASNDGSLYLWTADTGTLVAGPVKVPGGALHDIAFSTDDQLLAAVQSGASVQVVAVESGEPIGDPLADHADGLDGVRFSEDNRSIATVDGVGAVRIWDVGTGRRKGQPIIPGPGLGFRSVSADGERVALAGSDGRLWVWQVETGRVVVGPLSGHIGYVAEAAFSSDGKWLATVGMDEAVRLWDMRTGGSMGSSPPKPSLYANSLSFNPDGSTFVTAGLDGIQIWRMYDAVAAELCAKLTSNISRKNWREWIPPDIGYRQACPDLPIAPDGS